MSVLSTWSSRPPPSGGRGDTQPKSGATVNRRGNSSSAAPVRRYNIASLEPIGIDPISQPIIPARGGAAGSGLLGSRQGVLPTFQSQQEGDAIPSPRVQHQQGRGGIAKSSLTDGMVEQEVDISKLSATEQRKLKKHLVVPVSVPRVSNLSTLANPGSTLRGAVALESGFEQGVPDDVYSIVSDDEASTPRHVNLEEDFYGMVGFEGQGMLFVDGESIASDQDAEVAKEIRAEEEREKQAMKERVSVALASLKTKKDSKKKTGAKKGGVKVSVAKSATVVGTTNSSDEMVLVGGSGTTSTTNHRIYSRSMDPNSTFNKPREKSIGGRPPQELYTEEETELFEYLGKIEKQYLHKVCQKFKEFLPVETRKVTMIEVIMKSCDGSERTLRRSLGKEATEELLGSTIAAQRREREAKEKQKAKEKELVQQKKEEKTLPMRAASPPKKNQSSSGKAAAKVTPAAQRGKKDGGKGKAPAAASSKKPATPVKGKSAAKRAQTKASPAKSNKKKVPSPKKPATKQKGKRVTTPTKSSEKVVVASSPSTKNKKKTPVKKKGGKQKGK